MLGKRDSPKMGERTLQGNIIHSLVSLEQVAGFIKTLKTTTYFFLLDVLFAWLFLHSCFHGPYLCDHVPYKYNGWNNQLQSKQVALRLQVSYHLHLNITVLVDWALKFNFLPSLPLSLGNIYCSAIQWWLVWKCLAQAFQLWKPYLGESKSETEISKKKNL